MAETTPDANSTGPEVDLGKRLRRRRKELGLTLQHVADEAGLSVGFISQIERGITVPSLVSLTSVSRVLKTDMSTFFKQPTSEAPITRHKGREVYGLAGTSGKMVTYERLSAAFPGNVLRSTLIHEPPGFRSEPMSHEGEEIFYVVDGAITIELDGETTVLETGDTAHFPSMRVHTTWNHTSSPATILHTCTMDVFGEGVPSGDPKTSLAVTRAVSRRSAPKEPKIRKGNSK